MRSGSATLVLVGGILLGWPMPSAGQQTPTYTKHVAPILFKHAEVGGNIGGDYRLFFKSAPFTFKGKQVKLNHTIYLAAPLTFRVDVEVAADAGPFMHMSPWRFRKAP